MSPILSVLLSMPTCCSVRSRRQHSLLLWLTSGLVPQVVTWNQSKHDLHRVFYFENWQNFLPFLCLTSFVTQSALCRLFKKVFIFPLCGFTKLVSPSLAAVSVDDCRCERQCINCLSLTQSPRNDLFHHQSVIRVLWRRLEEPQDYIILSTVKFAAGFESKVMTCPPLCLTGLPIFLPWT